MTQHIEPVAYAAFSENGNVRIWSQDPGLGSKVEPLVRLSDAQAALAAAEERGRSEERGRCAKIAIKQAPATQDFSDAPLQDLAKRIADAITKEPTP